MLQAPNQRLPNTGEVRGSPQTSFEQRRDGRKPREWEIPEAEMGLVCVLAKLKNWLVVEPTHLKHISQIGKSSPTRDEHEKYLKPPPSISPT